MYSQQSADGERKQKKIEAQAATVAGEAKGKGHQFTEEEAYLVGQLSWNQAAIFFASAP